MMHLSSYLEWSYFNQLQKGHLKINTCLDVEVVNSLFNMNTCLDIKVTNSPLIIYHEKLFRYYSGKLSLYYVNISILQIYRWRTDPLIISINICLDIEVANRHGHTCLMIACYKGEYLSILNSIDYYYYYSQKAGTHLNLKIYYWLRSR